LDRRISKKFGRDCESLSLLENLVKMMKVEYLGLLNIFLEKNKYDSKYSRWDRFMSEISEEE
jgi:hypothetical protein